MLVVWGVVALAGAESVTWDPLDNDSPEAVIVQDLALPSLPPHLALPREKMDRLSAESPPSQYATSHISNWCGVPAESGRDLLTYLEISRT
jgi:hypothetical protein